MTGPLLSSQVGVAGGFPVGTKAPPEQNSLAPNSPRALPEHTLAWAGPGSLRNFRFGARKIGNMRIIFGLVSAS